MSRPALVQRLGRPFGVALLTASLLGQVQATTFSTLTLVQQARKAEVIVQAVIGTPSTISEGGQSYLVYPLKVSETLAGDVSQLPQVGGGPALYVLGSMDQAPVFQAGQEAVLLLYKGRLDSPLVGFNQGAYLISAGQVSVLPVAGAPVPQSQPGASQDAAAPGGTAQPGSTPATVQPGSTVTAPTLAAPSQTPPASQTVGTSTAPGAGQVGNGIGAPDKTAGAGVSQPAPTPPTPPQGLPPGQGQGTVPATTPVVTPPASQAGTPPTTPGSAPAAAGAITAPGSLATPPVPAAAPVPAVTPAPPPGVLGSIKTPAQLKAAIVAARAAK